MKKTFLMFAMACALLQAEKKVPIRRFGEGDLQLIRTKTHFTTMIMLPEGEEVSTVICGDKEYWVIEEKDGIVYVKPAKEGATTNINIVAKSKSVYSFLVQEITKPGSQTKERPDLKIVLDADDGTKLRRDKELVEEVLARTEKELKDAKEKLESGQAKKKDESPQPKVVSPIVESPAPKKAEPTLTAAVVPPSVPSRPIEPPVPPTTPADVEEEPLIKTYVVDRHEGVIRKSSRAIGRFFRKLSRTLRIY